MWYTVYCENCECMCNVQWCLMTWCAAHCLYEFVTTKMKIKFKQKYKQMRKFKINLTLVRSPADDNLIRNVNLFMHENVNCTKNSIKIVYPKKNIIFWLCGKTTKCSNFKLSSGIFQWNGRNMYIIFSPFRESRQSLNGNVLTISIALLAIVSGFGSYKRREWHETHIFI